MSSVSTPQGFVRVLKADSDPPTTEGQYKIDISRQVWDNASFYVPNKAEVITDWILSKFLKEKDRELSSNPIFDLRFWTLLRDVMSSPNATATDAHMRPSKLWLPPILNRIAFFPTLCSLLSDLHRIETSSRIPLSLAVYFCLVTVWPAVAQKLNLENLLECLCASTAALNQSKDADPSLARISIMVALSYRHSFGNSVNKKKVYLAFTDNHISQWLRCVSRLDTEEPYKMALDCIYHAGIDTLFNLEILRQGSESKPGVPFMDSIAATLSSNLEWCAVLPRLFASYVEAVKRHRNALTGQGHAQYTKLTNADIQIYTAPFLASCLSLLDAREQTSWTWVPKVALLSLVKQEKLFDHNHSSTKELLNGVVEQALELLEAKTADTVLETSALESLSALCRIDYDLIAPSLPSIISKLLPSRPSITPAVAFLNLVLEYHTKTRTVDVYIETILSTLLAHKTTTVQNLRGHYESSLSGPLFHGAHLGNLSKAIQTFLTSTQMLTTPESIYRFLKSIMDNFNIAQAHEEERPTKRRKTTEVSNKPLESLPVHWAVAFSFSTEIAIIVLSSLPMGTTTEATQLVVRDLLVDVQTFTWRIVKSSMKTLKDQQGDDMWPLSIVAAASFRLQYALDTSNLLAPSYNDEKLCQRILEVVRNESLLPGLLIELFRFLLKAAVQRERTAAQATFDYMLMRLESQFEPPAQLWASQTQRFALAKTERGGGLLSLIQMIFQRWLPVVESFASEQQLERLFRLSLLLITSDDAVTSLQRQKLLLQTLQSAQFLELPRFRLASTKVFNEMLMEIDASEADTTTIGHTVAAYRLLLALPVEYLSRPSRSEFIRLALVLDRCITMLDDQIGYKYEYLTVARTFLARMFSHANTTDQSVENVQEALNYFMSLNGNGLLLDGLVSATLDLTSSLFLDLFKRSDNALDTISSTLRTLAQIDPKVLVSSVRSRSIVHMIEVLEVNFKPTSFPIQVQAVIQQFYQALSKSMESHILALDIGAPLPKEVASYTVDLLNLWRSLLCFGKWLGSTSRIALVGRHLIPHITVQMIDNPPKSDDKINAAVLAIVLEEFNFCPERDRTAALQYMLAATVSLHGNINPPLREQVDKHLSKISVGFLVSEFSHTLGTISEALKTQGSAKDRISLLQISVVLLRGHPQGTLKEMQSFITDCIHAFVGWHGLVDGPLELRLQTLEFLAQHCAEQPAVLRLGDIGGIWSLLARFLSDSCIHDDNTTLDIFHKITNITSALVRLRRDLVVHTLPHLASILRHLVLLLRTIRPSLGIKQTLLVTNTQPRWLNAKQPLGVEEARALARLLETLIVKSIARNNASGMDAQKAESLAKPFSKHAAYVLKAYVTAMNDPLCLLPLEHRRELQRGLYALCGVVGEHSRDAMMVGSLDAGGKITMKTLWKEYERQRYIGKG